MGARARLVAHGFGRPAGILRGARDYLLPLPNENFDGELGRRALYTDAAGFSRQLLRGLQLSGDNQLALLLSESAHFWTENSDRSGLDTWSA
jgi:hypothetical protein